MRISNWSRASLCLNVDRLTVNLRIFVGRGVGPCTTAPLRSAVSMIFPAASSRTIWSKAMRRMRMDSTFCSSFFVFLDPCTADSAISFAEAFFGAFLVVAPSLAFLAEDINVEGKRTEGGVCPPELLRNFRHDSGADGAASFTDGKPGAFFDGDWCPERHSEFYVVSRHHN